MQIELNVDWLKKHHYQAHFFGLGFVQVKIDQQTRIHFYHPELPAFTENPHNHRYWFKSTVKRGELKNVIWRSPGWNEREQAEEREIIQRYSGTQYSIEAESCAAPGTDLSDRGEPPQTNKGLFLRAAEFSVNAGSSYYINEQEFHQVFPNFEKGPCVTLVERGPVLHPYALVLRQPGEDAVCPFSKTLSEDELWQIVKESL